MIARIGTWSHDRRWLVLIAWVVVLFVANGVASAVGEDYRQDFTLDGAESTDGQTIFFTQFEGDNTGQTGTIVFRAEQGVDDPEVQEAMEALFADVAEMPGVDRVESPYDATGEEQLVSPDGTIAYANVEFPEDVEFADALEVSEVIRDEAPDIEGLQVERGGFIFAEFEEPTSEAIGLAFAIIVLIVAFGSVLAMGLPIGVALFGIGLGGAFVILMSRVMEVPEFAPFLGIMIGLGVGIDYALLIVTRHREQLHTGHTVRESIQIAMDTAGRSVLFAGMTVVISLLGMFFIGIGFIQGLAVTASATVLFTVVASMTLLPAFLGFAGERVERTRWRGLIAAGFVALGLIGFGLDIQPLMGLGFGAALITIVLGFFVPILKREVAHRAPKPRRETVPYRWSRIIQHRPWPAAILGAAVLIILSIPVLGLRLAFSDESNFADDTTTKKAYELLVDGFGEGFTGPLFLVAELDGVNEDFALGDVTRALSSDPDVALAFLPQVNEDGTAASWFVIPNEGPQDESTTDLVTRLRNDVLPPVEAEGNIDVKVSGMVAGQVDMSNYMAERMPYFFLAVLTLSFLLLMVVFRSLLVPLKAVIMNMLSIGAAYGITVALFQWGWFSDITNVEPGPIEPWAPMMLFAVVFGLSMDYEVFLLSRVREEWLRTGDSRTSVADGLAATAKVITAAAAIMVVVFGSFILEDDRTFKLMGTGLATAIFLDATIVRMLLVPATMELLGDRNWWLPRWLDRLLPQLDVEGHADPLPDDEEPERVPVGVGQD